MGNQTEQYNDQAEQLKNLVNELEQRENQNGNSEQADIRSNEFQRIDVLNLPPRKTIHGHKKKGFKINIRRPFMRFLVVSLITIILCVMIIYLWQNNLLK